MNDRYARSEYAIERTHIGTDWMWDNLARDVTRKMDSFSYWWGLLLRLLLLLILLIFSHHGHDRKGSHQPFAKRSLPSCFLFVDEKLFTLMMLMVMIISDFSYTITQSGDHVFREEEKNGRKKVKPTSTSILEHLWRESCCLPMHLPMSRFASVKVWKQTWGSNMLGKG